MKRLAAKEEAEKIEFEQEMVELRRHHQINMAKFKNSNPTTINDNSKFKIL